MPPSDKRPGAFLTIGELARQLGVGQHILRYWETKFPLRPLQRAGNRRYYRPADVELARRIHRLLTQEGYTVRGVQKLLSEPPPAEPPVAEPAPLRAAPPAAPVERLRAIRDRLQQALELSSSRSS